MKNLIKLISGLITEKFYGRLVIDFKDGIPKKASKEESILFSD